MTRSGINSRKRFIFVKLRKAKLKESNKSWLLICSSERLSIKSVRDFEAASDKGLNFFRCFCSEIGEFLFIILH